ncbi:helix-hairpin-helix domain-containing protein [Microbulbifer sp. OS29]|uniref:Helix-hairpin-helix domain-containing protein n=1 Tax=Microbulbifer okhotskensis TaxID=2926617 RepID=A0A9X2J4H5_9GAMM|nr:ComEA family DNA-binding protein [Microbulbifer okhotskensis]MCO1334108.1 helix-hairpin-helix domain-containing protein [Microbulbifer okhotskensis]
MKLTYQLFTVVFALAFSLFLSPSGFAGEVESTDVSQVILSVNVNSASADELAEKLDGVGVARAELIIRYRKEHGPFTSIDQLLNVKGIGTATLDKNRDVIRL